MQNKELAIEHIRNHATYPTTAADLKAACNNLADFSEEDKQWFREHLPEGTYGSPDEVIQALGW